MQHPDGDLVMVELVVKYGIIRTASMRGFFCIQYCVGWNTWVVLHSAFSFENIENFQIFQFLAFKNHHRDASYEPLRVFEFSNDSEMHN